MADRRPRVWVGHVMLATTRLKETEQFMREIGMRPIARGSDFAVLELRGGTHIVLAAAKRRARRTASFDLMVDDLDAMHRDLAKQGRAPTEITTGRIHRSFEVTEPSGVRITFNSSHVSRLPV
jgi:catechol-2,3-dioxygenase